jgi:hypothetical protein
VERIYLENTGTLFHNTFTITNLTTFPHGIQVGASGYMKVNSVTTWKRKVSQTCQAGAGGGDSSSVTHVTPEVHTGCAVCDAVALSPGHVILPRMIGWIETIWKEAVGWLRKTTKPLRIVDVLAENIIGHVSTPKLSAKWAFNILLEWRNNHW